MSAVSGPLIGWFVPASTDVRAAAVHFEAAFDAAFDVLGRVGAALRHKERPKFVVFGDDLFATVEPVDVDSDLYVTRFARYPTTPAALMQQFLHEDFVEMGAESR